MNMQALQAQIDAAYAAGDKAEIIRIGSLMGDIAAANFVPAKAEKHVNFSRVCGEKNQREFALEARILARDEYATMDF